MDRRGFLRLIGGGAAVVVASEAIPFNRVWSFPAIIEKLFAWRRTESGLYAAEFSENAFLDTQWVSMEVLQMLKTTSSFQNISVQNTMKISRKHSRSAQPLKLQTVHTYDDEEFVIEPPPLLNR